MKALDLIILAIATILSLSSTTYARVEKSPFHLHNVVINTPSHSIAPSSQFNITADINGRNQRIAFVLETNDDPTTQHTNVQYLDRDGNTQQLESPGYRSTKGSVWLQSAGRSWRNVGWARIVIVREGSSPLFEGTFTVRSKQYEIKLENPQDDARLTASPIASSSLTGVRHADSSQSPLQQPYCMSTPHSTLNMGMGISQLQARDESYAGSIGSTAECPQARQIAYIGVMTDCSFTAAFDSLDAVHRNILNIVNTASVVFENSFNISLGLQNLTISDPQCSNQTSESTSWNSPCTNGDMNFRLTRFSAWRSTVVDDTNAFWTLMTDCHNSGAEVGVSWVGELCNTGSGNYYSSQSGIGANVVARTGAQWQVFTHEAAHMFGAVHDCNSETCEQLSNTTCCPLSSNTCDADGDFIMNPSSSRGMTRFSPCTIGNVCSALGTGQTKSHCLVPDSPGINTTGVHNGRCGNGVLEPGEACDCGNDACGEDEARCCDMMTCQWRGGDDCQKFNPESGGESWTERHLGLIIGLSVGLGGGLILSALMVMGIWCWRRRRIITREKRFSSLSSGS